MKLFFGWKYCEKIQVFTNWALGNFRFLYNFAVLLNVSAAHRWKLFPNSILALYSVPIHITGAVLENHMEFYSARNKLSDIISKRFYFYFFILFHLKLLPNLTK